MIIRLADSADIRAMQEIEVESGARFAEIGMPAIAEDAPFSVEEFDAFIAAGLAWVALDERDRVVGYLVGLLADGRAHLEQVSVRPSHGRQGIGRALIDCLIAWSLERRLPAVTLTTFVEVPWNAPYYARLGFRPFAVDDASPDLLAIRAAESAHGLDRWPRTAMILDLRAAPDGGIVARGERRKV
jgi:GNAT superfamily N-acetyltransferase